MDRRSLAFFIIVFLGITASNLYFSQEAQKRQTEWLRQQAQLEEEKQQKKIADVAMRTASKESLPAVALYLDEAGQETAGFGVRSAEMIIALAHEDVPLKKNLYYRPLNSTEPLSSLHLSTIAYDGKVGFYQTERDKNVFKIASLPNVGSFDLQLISRCGFSHRFEEAVQLGEWIDGEFNIPLFAPQEEAIAVAYVEGAYWPIGFYDAAQHRLSLFSQPELKGIQCEVIALSDDFAKQPGQSDERFYILENEYQQLVFSTRGGSLVEINLPFKNQEHEKRLVLPIEFDSQLALEAKEHALFPARPAYRYRDGELKIESSSIGGYYPLIRREVRAAKGQVPYEVPARFQALNLVSDYPELANLPYQVKEFDNQHIVFEAKQPHRIIRKSFYLDQQGKEAPYCFSMEIDVKGDRRQLWLTSGVPEVEWISNAPAPQLQYRQTRNQKTEVEKIDLPKEMMTNSSVQPDWLCNSNGFFGVIIDPLTPLKDSIGFRAEFVPGATVPSRLTQIDRRFDRFKVNDLPGYQMLLPLNPKESETKIRVFAGPFAEDALKLADQTYRDPQTGLDPDYRGCQSFHGWFAFLSQPIAKVFFWVMRFFHHFTQSWALSIILLTCFLRLILYPLNAWSFQSMSKMQQIGPQVAAIQERYKKDPQRVQQEIMTLYREKGVNPLSGCFPMFIQMPFLMGMFDLLKSTFELRGASFIPGWIDNLTSPDVLFSWNMPLFFIGNQLHLLPILLGGVMLLQQKISSTLPQDKSTWTDQQRQQNMMGSLMAAVFTFMFYHFPSGLNIYWLSSMLLSMIQQWATNRRLSVNLPNAQQNVAVSSNGKKGIK